VSCLSQMRRPKARTPRRLASGICRHTNPMVRISVTAGHMPAHPAAVGIDTFPCGSLLNTLGAIRGASLDQLAIRHINIWHWSL
jgi:hypothetical protein